MAAKKAATKKTKRAAKAKDKADSNASYVVFARRFRPQAFDDVVGQATVTGALRHALKTGRLAQAYILAGPRGVGKTSLARIFAKALNCQNGSGPNGVAEDPCNACDACESIQEGSSLDVIEMDAATNRGINEIRDLRDNVGLAPSQLRSKVYIVDEVHMLTNEAWNAFLKTLEEPPPHVKFVFATTDADKIPETILSRCQRFDLRRIGLPDIVKRLRKICETEKVKVEDVALDRIASLAKGGLRDAESMLDQAVNLGEGKVSDDVVRQIAGAAPDELIFELLEACHAGNVAEALSKTGSALDAGADPDDLLLALCDRLRGILLYQTCGEKTPLLEGQGHLLPSYGSLANKLTEDQTMMLIQLFGSARRQLKDAAQARLPLEMALVRASRAGNLVDLGKLVAAIESGGLQGAVSARQGSARPASSPRHGQQRGGPDPNALGRPVGAGDADRAATAPTPVNRPNMLSGSTVGDVGSQDRQDQGGWPDRWAEVLAVVRPMSGGPMIAGAISHARVARLDKEKKELELGFTAAQGFYRESLERPERRAVFVEALKSVYGLELEVKFTRAPDGSRPLPEIGRSAPPARRAPSPTEVVEDTGAESQTSVEETAVSFDDEGALPFTQTGGSSGESAPAVSDRVEASPSSAGQDVATEAAHATERIMSRRKATEEETEAAKKHPLVKVIVDQVDGEVMSVVPGYAQSQS